MDTSIIETIRKRKGLTQKEFAISLGVTTTGYQKMIDNGDLKVSTLEKISTEFGINILTFFGADKDQVNEDISKYGTNSEYVLTETVKVLNKTVAILEGNVNDLRRENETLTGLIKQKEVKPYTSKKK